MFLGSWVEVGMAAVLETAATNTVLNSYQWLVPCRCRLRGPTGAPNKSTSFVGSETIVH